MADDAPVDDVELLDAGGGARLERFGPFVIDRPHPGALEDRREPAAWGTADLRFDRERGWSGPAAEAGATGWEIGVAGLRLLLRTTAAGQIGLFPEHSAMLPWLRSRVAARATHGGAPAVLHLFAYTGLATLALARAGAALAHVDASRPAVAWARENAGRNDLEGAPIRWLVDDVAAFTAREIRRGRRYDGVILDPPTYGHGGSGQPWRLDRDLGGLLADVGRLLPPDGFVLLTAHTPGFEAERLASALGRFRGRIESGRLALTATSGARLDLGAYARLDGAS
jgi:23S rRNA (cytosine1962-C5)-methyltransferase